MLPGLRPFERAALPAVDGGPRRGLGFLEENRLCHAEAPKLSLGLLCLPGSLAKGRSRGFEMVWGRPSEASSEASSEAGGQSLARAVHSQNVGVVLFYLSQGITTGA